MITQIENKIKYKRHYLPEGCGEPGFPADKQNLLTAFIIYNR